MIIRVGKTEDLEEVFKLQFALNRYEARLDKLLVINKKSNSAHRNFLKKKIKNNGIFFVCEANKKVIGYIFGYIKWLYPAYTIERIGYIAEIFVLEEYRNRGVGKRLVKEILRWFKSKNIRYVELDCYISNIATKFWSKLGFRDYMKKYLIKI